MGSKRAAFASGGGAMEDRRMASIVRCCIALAKVLKDLGEESGDVERENGGPSPSGEGSREGSPGSTEGSREGWDSGPPGSIEKPPSGRDIVPIG